MYPLLDTYRKLVVDLGAKDVLGKGTSALLWNSDGSRAGGIAIKAYGIELNLNGHNAILRNDHTGADLDEFIAQSQTA